VRCRAREVQGLQAQHTTAREAQGRVERHKKEGMALARGAQHKKERKGWGQVVQRTMEEADLEVHDLEEEEGPRHFEHAQRPNDPMMKNCVVLARPEPLGEVARGRKGRLENCSSFCLPLAAFLARSRLS